MDNEAESAADIRRSALSVNSAKFLQFVFCSALVYYLLLRQIGVSNLIPPIGRFSLVEWIWPCLLSLVSFGLRFLRWDLILRQRGISVPPSKGVLYYFSGFLFTLTPGKSGELIRLWYLSSRHGVSWKLSFPAFVLEQIFDVLALGFVGFSFLSAPAFQYVRGHVVFNDSLIPLVGAAIFLLCVVSWFVTRRLSALSARMVLSRLLTRYPRLRPLFSARFSMREALIWIAIGMVAWSIQMCGLSLILSGLGTPLALTSCVGIYATSLALGALSFVTGGLGTTEAIFGWLLVNAGLQTGIAVSAVTVVRLSSLGLAIVLGGMCYAFVTFSRTSQGAP